MREQDFTERYMKLKKMRFSGMAEELKVQFEDDQIDKISADERIFRLIDAESETRDSKKFARILKAADLRYPEASINLKLMEQPGVERAFLERLSECRWIDERKDLIITGKTGTGKSYCACALGSAAAAGFRTVKYYKASRLLRDLQNAENNQTLTEELNRLSNYDLRALGSAAAAGFRTVKYYKASRLLRDLQNAENNQTLTEELNRLSNYDLLIVDDFGLMSLDLDMCRNLFELIDIRDGRKSNIFISQFPVSEWYEMFKDSTYADACLDRLTGDSFRIEFTGDSLRRTVKGFISQFPVSEWYEMFKDSTYADACLDRLTGDSFRIEFTGDSLRRTVKGE